MGKQLARQQENSASGNQSGQNSSPQSKNAKGKSNSEQIMKVNEAIYLENYQSSLGNFLGEKLYGAVSDSLTFDKLASYADKIISSLASSGTDLLNDNLAGGNLNDAQQKQIAKLLHDQSNKWAQEYLKTESGQNLMNKIQELTGENPYAVAGIGILAAVGAIIANADIPTIKQKFKLGNGFTAKGSVDLGKIRDIALGATSLGLEYKKEMIFASASVTRSEEGDYSGAVAAQFGTKERFIRTDIKINEEGIDAYNIKGLYSFNKDTSISGSVSGNSLEEVPNLNLQIKTKTGDIAHTGRLNFNGKNSSFQALYDGKMDDYQLGLLLNGNTETNELTKFGGSLKYQPSKQEYAKAGYQYDTSTETHSLDLSGQTRFGDISLRGTQEFDYNANKGLESNSELLGAYHVNNDLALIGGGSYSHTQDGDNFNLKAGVQYKDVPVLVNYDPKNKAVSLGVTLRF